MNFEKQLARGERSADEAKAYTIRKENAVPFTVDEPGNDEWLKAHAEDVKARIKSNIAMGRVYAVIDEQAAVIRETLEDRILRTWRLDRADVENALRELGDYRATELTPEQVEMDHEAAEELRRLCRDYDLGRLQELAEADKDGRVVVLPCKVGDTVYRVFHGNPKNPVISSFKVNTVDAAVSLSRKMGRHKYISVFLTREEAEEAKKALEEGRI